MGGECSQKLRPWRGMTLLSGAQQTSGSVENQHSTAKCLALRPEDHLRIYFFFSASGGAGYYDCGFSFPKPVLWLLVLPGEPNGQAPSAFSCERLGVCYAR
jgi:hypothetical protein